MTDDDALQEALIRAWLRSVGGSEPLTMPDAWVRRVATNLRRDAFRRARAERSALDRWAWRQPPFDVVSEMDDAFGGLAELISRLPRRQRDVVWLHYACDLDLEHVAAKLGISIGSVKRHLFRARQNLLCKLWRTPMHGWHLAGSHPANYEHGIRTTENFEGKRVAHLRCVTEQPTGFGTLMQTIAADDFRGRRVRFSGAVRATDADRAGLWMRVDGSHGGAPLAFDNMQQRPISGTTKWQRHNIVLDIADHARAIAFGVLLAGKGDVRVSDLAFEVVPSDTPTTGDPPLPRRPQNLDLAF